MEVVSTAQSFLSGSYNGTSFNTLQTCFAGEVDTVADMANGALDATIQATQSAPWQAFSGATLVFSLALMFLGFYLVRAVNFFGGVYIGSTLSLFVLSLFAVGTPLMNDCNVMLSIVSASALLLAIICVIKRKSMYVLLGLIAGEIVGKFFFHLLLERSGYGTNTLYVSIGFFAVVGAYAVVGIGDLAWMICTALMGAYFTTTSLVELVLIPYLPDGKEYATFLAYRPSPVQVASSPSGEVTNVVSSKYLWAPFGAMVLLTLIGLLTQLACYNNMMRNRKRHEVPLVAP